jgi:3-hydroxyisobutyrate dehydrogenase-like beta-hydroxyacid dehydrogenase
MAPVFGAPPVADAGQLLVVMAGDYRSKKEVAHLLVPGVGRKVIDLGGNLEKGRCLSTSWKHSLMILISV